MTGPSLLELSHRHRATQPLPSTPTGSAPSSPPANDNLSSDATSNPFLMSSAISGIRTTVACRDRLRTFADRAIKHLKEIATGLTEEQIVKWKPSKELAKVMRDFIWTILLLPNIQYYAGTVKAAILSAMRSSKVKELPAADSDEAAEVVKVVGRELSLIRSAMKKEIADSLEPGAETRNLAELTNSLLLHAPWVNPTLGLYYRIAYIQRHVHSKHSIHDFWPNGVDKELEEARNAGPQDFLEGLKISYEEDIEEFGDPAITTHLPKSDTFSETCQTQFKSLSAVAAKIQPLSSKSKKSKKRKRVVPEPDEDQEEIPNGSPDGEEAGGDRD
ncbi:hypothetical protein B0H10DRAFT_2214480 [Mycena sp. CBHHK59/15]|nr:hypothetical protein B0H10DRAFT_2214480 [Mycena sp. CBHHK59/15]